MSDEKCAMCGGDTSQDHHSPVSHRCILNLQQDRCELAEAVSELLGFLTPGQKYMRLSEETKAVVRAFKLDNEKEITKADV